MNQILQTSLNKKFSNFYKFKKFFRFQLFLSIFLIIFIVSFIFFNKYKLYEQERYSSQILSNYNITKLYSDLKSSDMFSNENVEGSHIIGIIDIPKLGIYYPVFSNYDDELLRVSPCKFYGPQPGNVGNLCIAGHNYDNDKFFSKISNLNLNDEIVIYNNFNKKFSYFVFDIYEVKSDDLSPVYSYDKNSRQLTLITCNNLNNNRIIVKALYKT